MSIERIPRSGCAAGNLPGSRSSATTTGSISVTGAIIRQPPPAIDTWCHSTVCAVLVSHSVITFVALLPVSNCALRSAHALAAAIAMAGVTDSACTAHAAKLAINAKKMLFFIRLTVLFRQAATGEVYTFPKKRLQLYTESAHLQMKKTKSF